MSDPTVLAPAAVQVRKFPWPVALVGASALFLAQAFGRFERWPGIALMVVGLICASGLGTWAEHRLFSWARAMGPVRRVGLALAVPPLAILALVPVVLLASSAGHLSVTPATSTVVLVCFCTALWVASTGVGSLVVLVLDLAISALVPDFRSRIIAAVFALIALVSTLAAAVGRLLLAAGDELLRSPEVHLSDSDGPLSPERIADLGADFRGLLTVLLTAVAVLLGLPALLSACGKLADAVMERLIPLARAFDQVSRGQLSVRVEEGGSEEFRQLNRGFNRMVSGLELARGMERTFGAYLGEPIVARIRQQHGQATLPPSLRDATVMFADIRGFTSMSEKLTPDQVLALLNRYLDRAVQVVEEHEGYINKFIGDAIVVVFNGPIEQADHAERGARCALALQAEVERLNAAGAFPEVGRVSIGVGVASGPLVAGNLGGKRTEYTVIGDTVNLAARLTSHAGAGEVWVSDASAKALPTSIRREALAPLKVKGKELLVQPWRLLEASGA